MIEVVYYRYYSVYREEHDSVEAALRAIEYAEDDGQQSTVGVFRDGEPVIWRGYVDQDPPTPEQAASMREDYAKTVPDGSERPDGN